MPHTNAFPLDSARRLWQAFLSARVLVAAVLVAVLVAQTWSGDTLSTLPHALHWHWALSLGYLGLSLVGWHWLRYRPPAAQWGKPWLLLLAADVAIICLLQEVQSGKMHYTPLLALPILTTSVMGSMRLSLATTAGITLVLLGGDLLREHRSSSLGNEAFMQTALVCAGFFAVAYLTRQLSQRLAHQEQLARQSRQTARMQTQVNGLIIANLSEGVLVVDAKYQVHMANPAAAELLGVHNPSDLKTLQQHLAWHPLRDMVDHSFMICGAHRSHVHLLMPGSSPTGLFVRTWLTSGVDHPQQPPTPMPDVHSASAESLLAPNAWLCVMFLNDLREMEARLRTEKMAAMGRMSAAVAHEIRNPLAAILQANALLGEELVEAPQQRLCQMVEQNAQRLARIAEEVLDIARVQQQTQHAESRSLLLDQALATIWQDWRQQTPERKIGAFLPGCDYAQVIFENEHLRRVVINLLDNAARHCSPHADALQLLTGVSTGQQGTGFWLQVWSEGPALDASVQKHLFEPFFSSQSRSTGLGLFICRELCQRHGAQIGYTRIERMTERGMRAGNAFTVHMRGSLQGTAPSSALATNVV